MRGFLVSLIAVSFVTTAEAQRQHTWEAGFFIGGYVFSEDSRLGTNDPTKTAIAPSLDVGLRMAYLFGPKFSAEIEVALMPTEMKSSGDGIFVFNPRIHAVLDFRSDKSLQPFALLGVGALTAVSSDEQQIGNGIWPNGYIGAGVRYIGSRRMGLRADARLHIMPGREGTAIAPEFEFLAAFVRTFGGPENKTLRAGGDEDGDGLINRLDKCPEQKEDLDGFQDDDGCPDIDDDEDGVIDANDKCPQDKETNNGYKDDDGCRDSLPQSILEVEGHQPAIAFERNSEQLTAKGNVAVKKLAAILYDHGSITYELAVHVSGTADDLELSWQRASVVKDALILEGITEERILATGYGADSPNGTLPDNRVVLTVLTKAEMEKTQAVVDGRKETLDTRAEEAAKAAEEAAKAEAEAAKAAEEAGDLDAGEIELDQ